MDQETPDWIPLATIPNLELPEGIAMILWQLSSLMLTSYQFTILMIQAVPKGGKEEG